MEEVKTVEVSQKLFMLISGAIIVVAVFMVGQLLFQFQSLPQNAPHEVNVTGGGKAYAKPDIAMVSFGMHTQAAKSQDAVTKNNEIMNKVISSIKESGVEDKDIQTTLYQLMPQYDYEYDRPVGAGGGAVSYPYPGPGKQVLRGYYLDQQIQVKIRNFDKINEILDKAASNGANTIGQLQFTVDDMEKVIAEAREKAITAAREKARTLFNQSGLRNVKLVNISEGYSPYPVPMYGKGGAVAQTDAVAPQVQTGQLEINTTVTLTYRVR